MVRYLLNVQGVDFNCKNKYHQTPLIAPARDGHEGMVGLLLDQSGIEPDVSDHIRLCPKLYGQTPLSYAAMNGHVGVLRALLATGRVDVKSKDMRGWTPLAYAAAQGRDKVIEGLITVPGIQLDSREQWGYTPLILAADEGHEAVTRLLIKQEGVHADAKDSPLNTALWFAARNGHSNVAKLLLDKGCNPHTKSRMGSMPLSRAVQGGHDDIVQWMQQSKHRPKTPRGLPPVSEKLEARLRQHRQHSE